MQRSFKWFLFLRTFFYYSILTIEILLLREESYHFLPVFIFIGVIIIDTIINALFSKEITSRVLIFEVLYFSFSLLLTGDAQSPFIPFYFVLILLSAANLSAGKTFGISALISLLHGIIVFGKGTIFPEYIFYLKISTPILPERILIFTIYVLLYFFVAALSSYIAERLKAEVERLRVTTEDILNTIGTGILTISNNGKILFINRAGQKFLLGRESKFFNHIDQLPEDVKNILAISDTEKEVEFKNRYLSISQFNLHKNLGKVYVIGDLTEKKAMEKKLILYDRMATIGKFAADIAHEIRNPIMSIKTSAQLLKRGKSKSEEEKQKLWNYIFSEIDRLENLTRDFLNFSREIKLKKQKTRLCSFLKSSIESFYFHPLLEKKKVTIQVECDENMETNIDIERMKSVIINLVENALQAVHKNGIIRIRGHKENGKTVIEVIDNGIGIPDNIKEKVFSPFFSTRKEGFGFGLAIVKKVVELHNGIIELESEEGKGTTFRILL